MLDISFQPINGLCEQFLKALHYTHQGITKTLARARSYAYWPGIVHNVLKICCECEICAEDHAYPGIPNIHHADAHGPGLKYGADIGEIDSHPHLIVVDYYSFRVFEHPLPSMSMSSVITAFKTIFSDTGIPLTLVTDNTLCFTSEEFSDLPNLGTLIISLHLQGTPKAMHMQNELLVW